MLVADLPIDKERLAECCRRYGVARLETFGTDVDIRTHASDQRSSSNYLLTWNVRDIGNASRKPLIRSICAAAGYACPDICTLLERLSEENEDAQG